MPTARVMLASLANPPNTSSLDRCDEGETIRAVSVATSRTLRRREALQAHHASGPVVERLLGRLGRLRNPGLAAYRWHSGTLLSEPFGAVPNAVLPAAPDEAQRLVAELLGRTPPRALVACLANFGRRALELAVHGHVHIMIVANGRSLAQCSRCVASLVPDIDRWQAPPAGLFVLEERLLLLRGNALCMTAAHEFAHALDAVLARRPRSYLSFESTEIRDCFAHASGFVNHYAASSLDEYFAECVRAYVEVNDDHSSWLPLTRQDLLTRDPQMFSLIENLFRTTLM